MLKIDIVKQLSHFNLQANLQVSNEIVVLFGPSGSGKSTILNCIAGLNQPDKGHISLNGRVFFESEKKPVATPHRNIGYLFQDYALFPHMTVWKNISYGMKTEAFGGQLMKELRIDHLKDKYPHQISGGEKQRVAIARALATEPDLLLLDEPFSALDDDTKDRSHDELLRIHSLWNIPIILVTHSRMEAKKLADRILFISDGKILKDESTSDTE